MGRRKKPERPRKTAPHGTEPSHAERRVLPVLALPIAFALLLAVVIAALLAADLVSSGSAPGPRRAAILDQLSLTHPNPEFVASARAQLEEAGYLVDYYSGEQVSVDLYRHLPAQGYDVVILRVHSAITYYGDLTSGEQDPAEYVSLFTGEPYRPEKYVEDRLQHRLSRAFYYEDEPPAFGIGPRFIEESMEGSFDKTLIVMMGCDGLRYQRTAQAFLDRGAGAFVSWSRPVSAGHTDATTERLLEHLLVGGLTAEDAVAETAAELGPDPFFGAELRILSGAR